MTTNRFVWLIEGKAPEGAWVVTFPVYLEGVLEGEPAFFVHAVCRADESALSRIGESMPSGEPAADQFLERFIRGDAGQRKTFEFRESASSSPGFRAQSSIGEVPDLFEQLRGRGFGGLVAVFFRLGHLGYPVVMEWVPAGQNLYGISPGVE